MSFNKTKSILLVCSGYSFWIFLDTFFWRYFEPQKYIFILEYNSSRLIVGLLMCALLVLIQWRIIKTYSSKQFLSVIAIAAITLLFSIILAYFQFMVFRYWSKEPISLNVNILIAGIFRCLILLVALMGLFYVAYYRTLFLQQKEQIARTKALADEAQLLMLRYQINPHFLFNSLNAIQSMVEKG